MTVRVHMGNGDYADLEPERYEVDRSLLEDGGPLYDVTVQLSGSDGNAFAILGRVQGALRKAGASQEAIRDFVKEAKAGDYDHLLQTAMRYVNVE